MERAIRYVCDAFFAARSFNDLDDLNALAEVIAHRPLCQTSCRLNRIGTLGAQEDESGSIRTSVQRSDSSEAVATGEFFGGEFAAQPVCRVDHV